MSRQDFWGWMMFIALIAYIWAVHAIIDRLYPPTP